MKNGKEKRYIEEDVIDGKSTAYGMANLWARKIGQPFDLWVDEIGSDREKTPNPPIFKPKANGIQLDIVLHSNGKAEIINTDLREIQAFQYAAEAIHFVEKFQKPLLMHWYGEISSGELAMMIRLVVKKHVTLENAIESVLHEDYL